MARATGRRGESFLVTGGAGFIGSHLVRRLVAEGHAVTVLDDLSGLEGRHSGNASAGAGPGRFPERLADLEGDPRLRFVCGSASDASTVRELVSESNRVVHLAATVGVARVLEQPERAFRNNLETTRTVLDACVPGRVPVLMASSSEVYGKRTAVPFREDDRLEPQEGGSARWEYARSKALAEKLAFDFHRRYGVPVVVTRLFNTVGPGQSSHGGMVLPRFARQARSGQPLTVYGSGRQRRCFAHVSDVVTALLLLMRSAGAVGNVFNVGSDSEVDIISLAKAVRSAARSSSPIRHVPMQDVYGGQLDEPARRIPHLGRLHRATGFRPARSLRAIIEDVLAVA